MVGPAIKQKYGPYYESAIWKQLPQREAVGKAPMTPSQVAGATYGELEARYQTVAERQRAAREWMTQRLAQRTAEKTAKAQETGQAISGVATILGTGMKAYQVFKPKPIDLKSVAYRQGKIPGYEEGLPVTGMETVIPGTEISPVEGLGYGAEPFEAGIGAEIGTGVSVVPEAVGEMATALPAIAETALALPGIEAGVATAETASLVGATAGEALAGVAPVLSVLGPIGLRVGGLGIAGSLLFGGEDGCCFIFIEGEGHLTDIVRKYRDEHYTGTLVDPGYRWMASWLVPIMKRNPSIKKIVRKVMTQPLTRFAQWWYGESSKIDPEAVLARLFWPAIWYLCGFIKQLVEGGYIKWQVSFRQ